MGSGGCRGPARCACGDDPRRFVTRVLMRCRECAAEVAVTARVCSRCGAPIVGQPPVMADTVVADRVAGAVSDAAVDDAAGKAVASWVAGQAREPYVPGSGDRVPAELRLVLAGYTGVAGGLFAGALACATALVIFFFNTDDIDRYSAMLDRYNGLYWLLWWLFILAQFVFFGGLSRGLGLGLRGVFTRSGRISGFPLCCGGAAIHVRPR